MIVTKTRIRIVPLKHLYFEIKDLGDDTAEIHMHSPPQPVEVMLKGRKESCEVTFKALQDSLLEHIATRVIF